MVVFNLGSLCAGEDTDLGVPRKRESQRRNRLRQIGLWAWVEGAGIFLLITVVEPGTVGHAMPGQVGLDCKPGSSVPLGKSSRKREWPQPKQTTR